MISGRRVGLASVLLILGAVLLGLVVAIAPGMLGLAVGSGLLLGLIASPVVGLLALIILRPLVDQSEALFGLTTVAGQSPSALLGIAVLVASLVLILSLQRGRTLRDWLHPWWFFAVYVLGLSFLALDIGASLGSAGRILAWVMLTSVVMLIPRIQLLEDWLPRAAAWSTLIIAGSVILGFVIGPRSVYGVGEAVGFFFNPQGLAFPLVLMTPALLLGIGREDGRGNLYLLALALGTGIVFLSLSRTAWIAGVVVAMASGRLIGRLGTTTRRRLAFSLAIVVLVVGAAVFIRWDAVVTRMSDFQAGTKVEALGSGRGEIYGSILAAFASSPLGSMLFGSGLGESVRVTTAAIGAARVAHSDVLWILYETGIFGFMLFLVSTYLTITRRGRAAKPDGNDYAAVALASTLAMLCMAAFNGVIVDGAMTYYAVILGLGLRASAPSLARSAGGGE